MDLFDLLWNEKAVMDNNVVHIISKDNSTICNKNIDNKKFSAINIMDMNMFCPECLSELAKQNGIEL